MKKIFFLLPICFGIFFFTHQAYATENDIGRYLGSIVVSDNPFAEQYWYFEPETREKLLLKSGDSLSRILKKYAIEISSKDLDKIPSDSTGENIDYNIAHKFKGKFVKYLNSYWYINPLDSCRYQISDGEVGFALLKDLALSVTNKSLAKIKTSKNPNFFTEKTDIDFGIYENTMSILKNGYYQKENLDNKEMFYGSMEGLVSSLDDPHTQFFSPQNKIEFDNMINGQVEGIGAMVETIDNFLTIISPLADSPAEKAGLLPFDQVRFVDGIDISGFDTDSATKLIKGPENTSVILGIYRPETSSSFNVTIVRRKISIPSVAGKKIDNDIAYIRIHTFSAVAPDMFTEQVNALLDENTRGIILDLRSNPGGFTSSAYEIADFWLDKDDIIFQEKYPHYTYLFKDMTARKIFLPTVVLVNKGTASASEIVTSALKNNGITIVGEKTFGKGTGQMMRAFEDGSALKYTIFEWLDSTGDSIDRNGINPDHLIKNTPSQDVQLQKAIDLLSANCN